MTNLVMDVASYQPDDLAFFQAAASQGVKAVIVKLTEGSNPGSAYVNPKAQNQINNARAAGLLVHGYHFADFNGTADAQAEANWFVQKAKEFGLGTDSVLALDLENSEVNANPATNDAIAFLNQVKASGYPLVDCYVGASWVRNGRVDPTQLGVNLWVAAYNPTAPGVDNVGTWQYTSSFPINGNNVDMSYDFSGYYTNGATTHPTNEAHLDGVNVTKDTITFNGWHAADGSSAKGNVSVILFDTQANKELARVDAPKLARQDVANIYQIDGANESGFSAQFPAAVVSGHKFVVVHRYSDDGNNGAIDYWFNEQDFTKTDGRLDGKSLNANTLHVNGWLASDYSVNRSHTYAILFNKTDDKEVERVAITPSERADVASYRADIIDSLHSGFTADLAVDTTLNGKELQIVWRYADGEDGNGNTSDFWSDRFSLTVAENVKQTEIAAANISLHLEVVDGKITAKIK